MAESVVGEAGNDVKMSVRHNLSGGAVIVHNYIYPVGVNTLFDSNRYFFDNRANSAKNFIGQIINIFVMFFGNNQSMAGIIRIDVKKGEKVIILVNNIGRNFFFYNFAENTFVHGLIKIFV